MLRLTAATVFLLCCPTLAQELPRARVSGRVRAKDKKPWIGATVVLVTRPFGTREDIGSTDRVAATVGPRGRFDAKLLIGRPYSAWAEQATDDGGKRFSKIAEDVTAGKRVQLDEDATRYPQPIQLLRRDRWKAREPLRINSVVMAKHVVIVPVPIGADDTAVLPALPGIAHWEVSGKDGLPIHWQRGGTSLKPQKRPMRITLPKERRTGIAVRDIDTAKGIGGAALYAVVRGALAPIGKTDPDGYVELELPAWRSRPKLFAVADGYGPAALQRGVENTGGTKWTPLRDKAKVDYHCRMIKGARVEGRLMANATEPLARASIVLQVRAMHFQSKNSRYLDSFTQVVRTDDAGRFVLPANLQEYPPLIGAVLTDQQLAALPEAWQRGLQPVVPSLVSVPKKKNLLEAGDLRLDRFQPVELTVTLADGFPAAGARLRAYAGWDGMGGNRATLEGVTDRRGRVRMLLPPGSSTIAGVTSGDAWGVARLVCDAQAHDDRPVPLGFALRDAFRIRGHVKDGAGKPIEGIYIYAYCQNRGLAPLPPAATTAPVKAGSPVVLDFAIPAAQLSSIYNALSHRRTLKTDTKGAFELLLPPVKGTWQLYGSKSGVNISTVINVEGSIDDLELTGN